MNKDNDSDQLEQLLMDKDVNALNPEEQKLVIRELGSLDKYASLRSIAAKTQIVFSQETMPPSSAVLGNILSRVGMGISPKPVKPHFYQLPLPLYQAAAAVVLAMGITWWWAQSNLTLKADPIVINMVDTVYQEVVRVDTIQVATPSKLIHTVASGRSPRRSIVKSADGAFALKSYPDYRFSRGDFPIAAANRTGQSLREQYTAISLDSMPQMDQIFVADRTL